VSEYLSEEEQVEALKKWWKENGRSIVAGAILGLGGVFGWKYWVEHRMEVADQASYRFSQMQIAIQADNRESALKQAEILSTEYGTSSYGQFASLYLARAKADAGESEAAQAQLEKVMNSGKEVSFQQIARLRLARLLLDRNDLDGAAALITKMPTDEYAGEFEQVRGDIALARGNRDAARNAYQQALEKGVGDTALVRMKLDDLSMESE
jgi:predicted negative regulator of RcsB-dependent stress response